MNQTQTIDLDFKGRRHWFEVYRFDTEPELHAALHTAGIKFEKGTVAYTDNYSSTKSPEECGRMWLLDKSVSTLAHEATHMALGILARSGQQVLIVTTANAPEAEEDLCYLVGHITSELYSQNRFY